MDLDPDDGWIRDRLTTIGPQGLKVMRRILASPTEDRNALLRGLMGIAPTPGKDALAQLVAVCDENEVARLRVLRGIRDVLDTG